MTAKNNNCKIVDCTIRDGGLVNNWDFSVEFVQDLYESLNAAGVEYMEIGYKNSPKLLKSEETQALGVSWTTISCARSFRRKANTKLSALVDVGRVDENDMLPRSEAMLDLIRVACYIRDMDKAIELVNVVPRTRLRDDDEHHGACPTSWTTS